MSVNLWILYVGGYAIIYPIRMWADKKRGEPFEDPELMMQKNVIYPTLLWMLSGLVISIFTPISSGLSFYIGIVITMIGMIIVILAFNSFAQGPGLNTSKLHKATRNPNYIGWDIFMGGLALIGLGNTLWSYLFLLYFPATILFLHYAIIMEEKFLLKKYGDSYKEYLESTPRYF